MKIFTTTHNKTSTRLSRRILILICLFVFVVSFITQSSPAMAVVNEAFLSRNRVLFSGNPDAATCGDGSNTGGGNSGGVSGGASKLVKTETLTTIFETLIAGGMNSVQAAAVMGSMYTESKFDSGAVEGGNGIGYGLVQWSFGRRVLLEKFANNKGVPASNIPMQMEFLFKEYNEYYKGRLTGTEFEKKVDISKATEAWMMKFEVPKMWPSNDPAKLNSERIPAALRVHELYKDLAPSTGAVETKNCSSDNGAVSGSIIKTALGFALTSPISNGHAGESDARDTYQVAKKEINPRAQWSDCGGFVATVMIASGVDPEFAKIGVAAYQTPYVKSHPEKYKVIENISSVSQLQPGDILQTTGHTLIYTGESQYPGVDASLHQRVPSVRPMSGITWMINKGVIAARIIK